MKQIQFETRHKAEVLLKEALAIWKQSNQVDTLDGIEQDPAFSLLMMALAWQANETDSELERLKAEVVNDFARLMVPYEMGHAVPATAVVETALQDDVAEMTLDSGSPFLLAGEHPFLPLLQTRVLNLSVRSVVRLDGRRWKVSLGGKHPVRDLSGFSFAVKDLSFRNLTVSVKGQPLPLIKPWHYSELPFAPLFTPDALTFNLGQVCNFSQLPMDLFARQNIHFFCVDSHPGFPLPGGEAEQFDMVFEFSGIQDDFSFDKSCLYLNPVLLVNAQEQEASLSAASPVARLVGGRAGKDLTGRQFLHLIRPLESQIFGNTELEVRGVSGDRFNQGSLLKLINCILTRYRSDFYAFQQIRGTVGDEALLQLETALARLKGETAQQVLDSVSGVYLMPRGWSASQKKEFSLNVKYLTTAGAAINPVLTASSVFTPPSGFQAERTRMIAAPVPGTDEIREDGDVESLLRYYVATGDRIVTPADVKQFCRKELAVRYGIGSELIRHLGVHRRRTQEHTGIGYEILVEIVLAGDSFIRRSFSDKRDQAEYLLQKTIAVRCANIYPPRVSITIENE